MRRVVLDADARLHARPDHEERHLRPALREVLVLADEARHGGRERDAVEHAVVEEVAEERAELVSRPLRLGGDAPALAQLGAVVEPEDRLRITDVDREQHPRRP